METVRAQPWESTLGGGAAALRRAGRGDDAEEGCAASAAMTETQVFMAVRSDVRRSGAVGRRAMARSAEPDAPRRWHAS